MISILSHRVASNILVATLKVKVTAWLQQNRVWPISLWFEVGFYNFLTERIIDGKKQELMIIKELFEGPVGDYCIARNTIKCLFLIQSSSNVLNIGGENVYSRSIIHVWRAYLVTMSPFYH